MTTAAPATEDLTGATRAAQKLAYERNKLHKRLMRQTGQAIGDFGMIGQNRPSPASCWISPSTAPAGSFST